MSTVHRLAIVLVTFLALTPAASAQAEDTERKAVPVTFYGHVFSFGYDFPMPTNTQFPKGEDNLGLGAFDWCAGNLWINGDGDVPGPDTEKGCDGDSNNKLVLFSTAGPVDIGSRDEFFGGDTYVQFHNERGSTKDILLDPATPVTATIFMSLDIHAWSVGQAAGTEVFPATTSYCALPNPPDTSCPYPYWGWDPAQWPDWVVKATLYYSVFGDYGSGATEQIPIRESIESGQAQIVAEGQVGPATLTNGLPGAPNVHRFDINLGAPKITTIPKEANFFLVYSFYSQNGDTKYSAQTWRVWTGEFFPPSFVLPTRNPFDVELVAPVFLHGKLVILGALNTPWGSYDVDPDATTLVITDSAGKVIEPRTIDTVASYKFAHGAHYKPVNLSYIWNFQEDNLAPGKYTATISGANQQGTAQASCTAKFEILPGGRPGNVEVGRCGQVSALSEQVVQQGGGAPTPGERERIAAMLPYGLGNAYLAQTAGVAPAPAPASAVAPLAATVAVVALGLVLRRRWGS